MVGPETVFLREKDIHSKESPSYESRRKSLVMALNWVYRETGFLCSFGGRDQAQSKEGQRAALRPSMGSRDQIKVESWLYWGRPRCHKQGTVASLN